MNMNKLKLVVQHALSLIYYDQYDQAHFRYR